MWRLNDAAVPSSLFPIGRYYHSITRHAHYRLRLCPGRYALLVFKGPGKVSIGCVNEWSEWCWALKGNVCIAHS
jgi:hypothetical protein